MKIFRLNALHLTTVSGLSIVGSYWFCHLVSSGALDLIFILVTNDEIDLIMVKNSKCHDCSILSSKIFIRILPLSAI